MSSKKKEVIEALVTMTGLSSKALKGLEGATLTSLTVLYQGLQKKFEGGDSSVAESEETLEASEPNPSELLSELRQCLNESPTVNNWWSCVQLVAKSEGQERALLKSYLLEHTQSDEEWNRCRLACGDWDKDMFGWELCEITSQSISSLPNAVEIYCPPGSFRMGASPGDEKADDDEFPVREVTLTPGFWALSTPVTQEMYEAVMGENPSQFIGARRPVETVDWHDTIDFCNKLSEMAGLSPAYKIDGERKVQRKVKWLKKSDGFRLITEAEWEYIARAGSTGLLYGELDEIAWHGENSGGETHPVGEKLPNAWGFYDMLGNVTQWCADAQCKDAYSKLPDINPAHLPVKNHMRMFRGFSWMDSWSSDYRVSGRFPRRALETANYRGFRIVRPAKG